MSCLPLRPAAAYLSRKALRHNLEFLKEQIRRPSTLHRPDSEILAMVKADAYGHDLDLILPELERLGVRQFALASLEEALEARALSNRAKILVLGGTLQWTSDLVERLRQNRFSVAVNDLQSLQFFLKHSKIPIHLKLDTGMNRLGLKSDAWSEAVELIKKSKRKLEGLFTHFATFEDKIFDRQARLFEEGVQLFFSEGIEAPWIHSENSAALLSRCSRRRGFLSRVGNLVRPGIALYGYDSRRFNSGLRPVLELVSEVGLVKRLKKGEGVSYGHLYRSSTEHDFGIVPLGYADGLSKIYSRVLKPELRTPLGRRKAWLNICGAICMDMVMVKSRGAALKTKDLVVFWGRFPNRILQEKVVEPYELNLRISKRIPRIWVP